MNSETTPIYSLHISDAGSGWELIMQSGVAVPCMVGISLKRLLEEELALPADLLARIDVLLLDGKPVDKPEEAIVRNGIRLAMAAGLPGIAGLAMRSGSAVRGLRPGITHAQADDEPAPVPGPGCIELALFSLALPLLAPHFLARGVIVSAVKLSPYLRPALTRRCLLNGRETPPEAAAQLLAALDGETPVMLRVCASA